MEPINTPTAATTALSEFNRKLLVEGLTPHVVVRFS
jgi:hypothetical protein